MILNEAEKKERKAFMPMFTQPFNSSDIVPLSRVHKLTREPIPMEFIDDLYLW